MTKITDFTVKTIDQEEISLSQFTGKVLLIVNVASKCGFTPQYAALQELYDTYRERGFEILAFPCGQFMNQEFNTNEEIKQFCSLQYHISFPLFAKVDVKGPNAHPLYTYLTEQEKGLLGSKAIKWNFTKFLINRNGEVVARFAPSTKPEQLKQDIERLL
ncbi:glutathione peroxidase [Heyndrickxia ginsengihumi]|uniref:Glutathione peroxidase n=1 Tax=Heyndrickxia ginsengihumi TaxID=363870 RepID=A0A0A6VH46_9BACI|nr:glutathione peroxidase [Heyndrickxia ginsengihumi]KHD86901.1 glutathione peroxidase [Heyndrickxia ginsengihumi]MBE6183834.1 glutathione peroxidase [Bacillus sp. (in: firmicutes)]MCM3021914.1 glutathione peroxidase [Heyndrickxia ginsengihumi]NEY20400.1 glutathione peroxidase [Heyndrickxia ginsengihumi]